MGQEKRDSGNCINPEEKRRADAGWTKKALAAYESSLGGKKESGKEVNISQAPVSG